MSENQHTITLEPNWEGVRRWLIEVVFPSDPHTARHIASTMGDEAPEFPKEDDAG